LFYTNNKQSCIIIPRFDSIAAFDSAIKAGQKNLDALHHQQYLLMLKNDVKGMAALDAPIKDAEKDLDGLKIGLGVTMGANIHGKAGNQLTGGVLYDPVQASTKPGLHVTNDKPKFMKNDTPMHVTELSDKEDKGVTNSGGGNADFFRGGVAMKCKVYLVILSVLLVSALNGCMQYANNKQSNSTQPMYHSFRTENNEWCVEINGVQYVLWPDDNWILINEESDEFIGYVDDEKTSLSTIKNDPDMKFLHVSELWADTLHVPLVRQDLVSEFALQNIDGIEWGKGGTLAEYLPDTLGQNVMRDKKRIAEFIDLVDKLSDEDIDGDWISAGCIYCHNDALPEAISIYNVSYNKDTIKISGCNTFKYALVSKQELERILGYTLEF